MYTYENFSEDLDFLKLAQEEVSSTRNKKHLVPVKITIDGVDRYRFFRKDSAEEYYHYRFSVLTKRKDFINDIQIFRKDLGLSLDEISKKKIFLRRQKEKSFELGVLLAGLWLDQFLTAENERRAQELATKYNLPILFVPAILNYVTTNTIVVSTGFEVVDRKPYSVNIESNSVEELGEHIKRFKKVKKIKETKNKIPDMAKRNLRIFQRIEDGDSYKKVADGENLSENYVIKIVQKIRNKDT